MKLTIAQLLCLSCLAVSCADGFVASFRPRSAAALQLSPLTRTAADDLGRIPSVARKQHDSSRVALMSSYQGGGYSGESYSSGGWGGDSSGDAPRGERRMEVQELHVEFTDDGRILLEVKGVKVSTTFSVAMNC